MSAFAGMEELLQDFLLEAGELLADVDNKLVELEQRPDDAGLLNDIFRGFHTIKGGAGFLGAGEMVALCHRTENLFDQLRNQQLALSPAVMDVILQATAEVRRMMDALASHQQPEAAPSGLLEALDAALAGTLSSAPVADRVPQPASEATAVGADVDWAALLCAIQGNAPGPATPTSSDLPALGTTVPASPDPSPTNAGPSRPTAPRAAAGKAAQPRESTIRVDTERLDQVLNLSGEIGLTRNRLNCLRGELLAGRGGPDTVNALDTAIGQLDLLVGDLQNAVMKTRMQPVGRLFQKYPRLVRDLARQLGKDVELAISGEETELDKTMIEDLNDPLVHLVRNAVDHGVEPATDRTAAGKPLKSVVRLSARQVGDHIVIEISDDGRGMRADVLRRKAIEKGLIDAETANTLDEAASLQLVFLPGFSTKDQISDVSGRGVGMDVVKTNIQKLNGRIDIRSTPGQGTTFSILLPLTLAIMPVLVVQLQGQSFAVPLSMVREILPLRPAAVQHVAGRATVLIRDEVLPVRSLAGMLGRDNGSAPGFGVLMQSNARGAFVLGVDGFVGRDDVVVKPLADVRPPGVSGATLSGDGSVVLVLDIEEMLDAPAAAVLGHAFTSTLEAAARAA